MMMKDEQQGHSEQAQFMIILHMAELIRDCSKSRPTTFNEITFSITQEIENKIKNKNLALRKKATARFHERQINLKSQETKSEIGNDLERGPLNYLQLFKPQARDRTRLWLEPDFNKIDQKDEENALHIYLLLKKRKPIFKVDEIKRVLRSKDNSKRMNYRQCECCGACGKHKCTHILCENKCLKKGVKESSPQNPSLDPEQPMVAVAQELIDTKQLEAPQIKIVQITMKQEEMEIPQIDVIDDELMQKQLEEQPHEQQFDGMGEAVVETERISEVESKSEVSESRRRSDARQAAEQAQRPEGVLEDLEEKDILEEQ